MMAELSVSLRSAERGCEEVLGARLTVGGHGDTEREQVLIVHARERFSCDQGKHFM